MKPAEWTCAKCGATNRKLVTSDTIDTVDKCVTCKTKHRLEETNRQLRWDSTAKP